MKFWKRSYSISCRICYRNILLIAILLVGQPLIAVADEMGTTISVEQALPAAEDGDLASEMVELDESVLKSLRIDQRLALLVVLPVEDGPADKAGLKPGDVILTLDGQPTPNLVEFTAAVSRTGSGEVKLGVWRRGERMTLIVRLESTSGRSASIEQVIEAYKVIGKTLEKRQFPAIWGFVQLAIGESYWIRAEGRIEDNLETAITAYKSALTVLTREDFPQQWARTEGDLALAYLYRVRGSRAENLDAAIEAYEATLTVLTKEFFPEDWGRVQEHLVQAYRARFHGERVDNHKAAPKAGEAALTVPSQDVSSAAATNQAPAVASAQPAAQQWEQAAKATVAQNEPWSPVGRGNASARPDEALRQPPRPADLKREAPQAGGESKQITQHVEASEPWQADSDVAKAEQTKPRQSGRLAARSSSAQDDDSPKRNDRGARRKAQQEEASDNKDVPQTRRYEAKMKTKCGGPVIWMDKRNHAHRPGTPGYGQRPGWFECR